MQLTAATSPARLRSAGADSRASPPSFRCHAGPGGSTGVLASVAAGRAGVQARRVAAAPAQEPAEIFSAPRPQPPLRTQELSNLLAPVPTGRGSDWPINPLFVAVMVHFKKGGEKEQVYMSQRAFCPSSRILMASLSWKILSCIPSGPQAWSTSDRSRSARFHGLAIPGSSGPPSRPTRLRASLPLRASFGSAAAEAAG